MQLSIVAEVLQCTGNDNVEKKNRVWNMPIAYYSSPYEKVNTKKVIKKTPWK